MRRAGRIRTRAGLAVLGLSTAATSGCAHDMGRPRRVVPYTAARPVEPAAPGGKTLVLGGYAGYNYGPGPVRRPAGRAEPAL